MQNQQKHTVDGSNVATRENSLEKTQEEKVEASDVFELFCILIGTGTLSSKELIKHANSSESFFG